MNMLDLFSGIGGFHKGFEQAGYKLDWVGFSEVDKYSSAVYKHRFKNVKDLGDVRTIQSKDLPKIDLITFGSPCQDFSQASGSRSGLKGHRSSLIRESIRLISECKPHTFIWENVKGTFSSNNGEDFWAIIQAFINIGGYRLEWELLNSRWFQVPQNRERIYLIGHLGRGSGRTVFPIRKTSKSTSQKINIIGNLKGKDGHECHNVHSSDGIAPTVRNNHGKITMVQLKQIGTIGEDSEATRVYDANGLSKTIKDGGGMGVKTGLYKLQERIRRLTPIECERLQSFPDNFTSKGIINNEVTSISNSQRYKQLGNAVTVNVVQAIAEKLNKIRR